MNTRTQDIKLLNNRSSVVTVVFTPSAHQSSNSAKGQAIFCAKIVAQKCASALKLLTQLNEVGSADPQVALLLLRQCGGFSKLVHLSRSTPPSLVADALRLYDDDVRQCFTECTSVDTPDHSWQQAQLSNRGGLGLRCLSHHSSAAYIASLTALDSGSNTNHHLLQSIQLYNSLVPVADGSSFGTTRPPKSPVLQTCRSSIQAALPITISA